jgi:hypothetical protein
MGILRPAITSKTWRSIRDLKQVCSFAQRLAPIFADLQGVKVPNYLFSPRQLVQATRRRSEASRTAQQIALERTGDSMARTHRFQRRAAWAWRWAVVLVVLVAALWRPRENENAPGKATAQPKGHPLIDRQRRRTLGRFSRTKSDSNASHAGKQEPAGNSAVDIAPCPGAHPAWQHINQTGGP